MVTFEIRLDACDVIELREKLSGSELRDKLLSQIASQSREEIDFLEEILAVTLPAPGSPDGEGGRS